MKTNSKTHQVIKKFMTPQKSRVGISDLDCLSVNFKRILQFNNDIFQIFSIENYSAIFITALPVISTVGITFTLSTISSIFSFRSFIRVK